MPYLEALEFEYPTWHAHTGERQLKAMVQGRLENPYRNYLDLLTHLKNLATVSSEEQLERFADCGDLSLRNPGSPWSRYALLLFQWSGGEPKSGWYDFNPEAYTALLHADNLLDGCFDGSTYLNLDYYLTGLAEVRVLESLPDDSDSLQQVWLEEGLIDFYWQTWPLRKILARVCQLKGWQWFCIGASENLGRYRNGLVALLAQQEAERSDPETLKTDLIHLHDELVMQAGDRLKKPEIQDLRTTIQAAIDRVPEF